MVFPLGMLRRERLHAVRHEVKLDRHRLFAPERAVVVEQSAMRSGTGTKSGEPGFVTFVTKVNDGLLGLAVVPRGQRVGGASDGCGESQRANERGSEQGLFEWVFIVILLLFDRKQDQKVGRYSCGGHLVSDARTSNGWICCILSGPHPPRDGCGPVI